MRQDSGIKEFKNGNLLLKLDKDDIEKAKVDKLLVVSEVLWQLDCYFVGEPFSLGNAEMGIMVVNYNRDLVYTFALSDLDKLAEGKAVRLYASVPSETDRLYIKDYT